MPPSTSNPDPTAISAERRRFGGGRRRGLAFVLAGCAVVTAVMAQRRFGRGGWGESMVPEGANSPRDVQSHSTGTPMWSNPDPGDVFTFARVRYTWNGRGGRGGWTTDTPDSDLNLSYRLQQMTSIRVNPEGRYVRLTDPDLSNYPFLYIVEPGGLYLNPDEVTALRRYLLNGGFLMLDDFWGDDEWGNVEEVFREVFPDRPFQELSLDHPLYHGVFTITSKGQVPNVGRGEMSQFDGVTWERPDAREVHHRGISDDYGRLMVLATHNTDNGDGWEREGEYEYFFRNFSEKISYPLGINIIFYVMTH